MVTGLSGSIAVYEVMVQAGTFGLDERFGCDGEEKNLYLRQESSSDSAVVKTITWWLC
jgi:hypothetical protein